MGKIVLAVTSDLHCGSTVAVCSDEPVPLDDGATYNPSKAQLWLWDCWHEFWARVADVRTEHKAKLFQEYNGDLVDGGRHHLTEQAISGLASIEADVIGKTLAVPLALKPDNIAIIRGTETHAGPSGNREESLARRLSDQGYPVYREPATGNHSHYHLRTTICDTYVSFTHHGKMGRMPHTKPNPVLSLARQIASAHTDRGELPPKIAFRSHFHQHVDTGSLQPVRVIQTCAWQLHTAFTHKVVPESLADIGGHIVVFDGKDFEVEHVLFKPKRTPLWKMA